MEVLFSPSSFNIKVASTSPPPDLALDLPWNRFNSDLRSFSSARSPDDDEIDFRSDSSSSIGDPDRDDDESDEESVSSTGGDHEVVTNRGLVSLGSLEESLPIKRGLSSHFSGKSKSFMNLAEANSVKDIEKPENSFNKRRRVLIASKLAKKSSFYTWPNPKSMPMLALTEEDRDRDYDDDELPAPEDDDHDEELKGKRNSDFHHRRLMSFKSRSFSLADLQQQHHDPPEEH